MLIQGCLFALHDTIVTIFALDNKRTEIKQFHFFYFQEMEVLLQPLQYLQFPSGTWHRHQVQQQQQPTRDRLQPRQRLIQRVRSRRTIMKNGAMKSG